METSKAEPADRNQAKAKLDQHDVKIRESEEKSIQMLTRGAEPNLTRAEQQPKRRNLAEKRLRSRAKLMSGGIWIKCEEKSDVKRDLDSDVKKRRRYQMSIIYEEKDASRS
ncbi:hypothetical protein F511_40306 [Dorcoceras hygrometricum]|uniref:Uncharacterized protein n=1 Tax=Dorcoceras hygrometricum TaxID=472368 RepID=A0A2Z7AZA0_9LAMI|nr:hypothetical protein F511_40306 [Dorcoceras hygrometricum]